MAEIKKLGIITSGGDCGGLNAVIAGVARTALNFNIEACLIPNGYAGLYNLIDLEPLTLDSHKVDRIHSSVAGSEAGHSRVKISKIKDENKYDKIQAGLTKHKIDGLIIAGGDDTGSVVVDLIEHGIKCNHVPKTMDLDLQTYSVGGDSTINRISTFTHELWTTGITHNRALVIEVFGRYSGHTALRGGLGADADCILIPEIEVDYDVLYEHFKKTYIRRLKASDVKGSTYIIVAAEGLKNKDGKLFTDETSTDSFGHQRLTGVGQYIRRQLEHKMKDDSDWDVVLSEEGIFVEGLYTRPEIREAQLGHLVRTGYTSAYDVTFGKKAGAAAAMLMMNGINGVTVVGVEADDVTYMETRDAIKQRNVELEEVSLYENMGVCFGRVPLPYQPNFKLQDGKIHRYM